MKRHRGQPTTPRPAVGMRRLIGMTPEHLYAVRAGPSCRASDLHGPRCRHRARDFHSSDERPLRPGLPARVGPSIERTARRSAGKSQDQVLAIDDGWACGAIGWARSIRESVPGRRTWTVLESAQRCTSARTLLREAPVCRCSPERGPRKFALALSLALLVRASR